jgi:hypothetical protein
VMANADVLVKACIAIYDLPIGEKPPDDLPMLDIPYPKFTTEEFQQAMGITVANAIDTVCALYLTEGDLILAANQLLDWSGIVSEKVTKDFLAS